LIPVVGPLLAAIPAIAVAGTVSYQKVLVVVIFFLVQQQFENHVLVPKVMSRQVGVSAVTVIIALLIGGKLLGILGALLAVPTAAILQVLFTEVMEMREKRVP
jgi:predicted PurR-regulated permease PerM